ncbi:MAG: Hsp20/alpha crystallin family protein [Gemmatimonas sp.]|jgi:HSP20 family protein|uniref:Hsp20/alpha crystallin family protein n=1 Tax=Gemmatimonas sp. TaxID=1962908 RepID=UPI00391FC916
MSTLIRRTPSPISTDDPFTGLVRRMFNEPIFTPAMMSGTWVPAVEVSETNEAMLLTAELPGIEEKAIKISIDNNVLTIAGEKEEERSDAPPAKNYYLTERFCGAFQRSFALPRTVDTERVEAEFEKGILKITLPKLPQAKGKVIEVQAK